MKRSLTISPRILSHLGEELIKNESIALLELVKNAYDACATECIVNFIFDDKAELESISIIDNGWGMNKEIIENAYLKVGTDFKYKDLSKNSCGRIPLGEKGIGRLGIHKLGDRIILTTRKKGYKEIQVLIDWNELDNVEEFDDFKIDLIVNDTPKIFKTTYGTQIDIEELKSDWEARKIREVYRSLTSLNSPFDDSNDNFNVLIKSNSNIFKGLPTFDQIKNSALYYGKCKMEGNQIVDFKYKFKPWSSLVKLDKGRSKSKVHLAEAELFIIDENKEKIDLDFYKIGPIELEVLIFEKDAQIFNYVNIEKSIITDYLKENGGIRVFRDGLRVYDYGERDNDWLGIDLKRVSKVGGRVSNNILIGAVKILRAKSKGLKEKTNREGFIENISYQKFNSAINYALSLIVRERNVDKQRLTTLYKKYKVIEPVLSDIDEVVEIIEDKIEPGPTKELILKYLDRIATQYKQVKEILIKSANAGLNLSVVIHEIEKILSELVGFIEKRKFDKALELSSFLEKIVRGYSIMIKKSSIKKNNLSEIVKTALENYEFRFLDHKIEVLTNHLETNLSAYFALSESISVLTNLLDNSIYWLAYSRQDNRKISVYISQKIKGYNSIVVSDNGPGFNIPTDVAVEPFITGKPHNIGSGLGLHIANEMMKAMGGQLLFLEDDDEILPASISAKKINKSILALCFRVEK